MASTESPLQILVPLRQWIHNKSSSVATDVIIRKITVAYGVAKLLLQAKNGGIPMCTIHEACNLDNFAVRLSSRHENNEGINPSENTREFNNNIDGVDMFSPQLSLHVINPFFSSRFFDEGDANDGINGACIDVEFEGILAQSQTGIVMPTNMDENLLSHVFGLLMYEVFAQIPPFGAGSAALLNFGMSSVNRLDDLKSAAFSRASQVANSDVNSNTSYVPLYKMGFPSSLSLLVRQLLECGRLEGLGPVDSFPSLEAASEDMHFMIENPTCYLSNNAVVENGEAVPPVLHFGSDKFYGREEEVSSVTDSFCRVSLSGESEAVFITGNSGVGKSALVHQVMDHVDVAGGYIITKKFDQVTQQSPISVVVSAFNDLCVLLAKKNSPDELAVIVNELRNFFGSYLSILARVLPNIRLLGPGLFFPPDSQNNDSQFNLSNVNFVLQLFMRVVSSRSQPVMLFLDDLQWSDPVSINLIRAILTDMKSSSSLFFVGNYRDDEVSSDHAIFRLRSCLASSNVSCLDVHLEGLNKECLNSIASTAFKMLPRLCRPLSDAIHKRTDGNPFFAMEYMRSLVHRGVLQICKNEGRWKWNNATILGEDITNNVCDLLASQIRDLPLTIQAALKITSSFGSSISFTIAKRLSASSEYPTLLQDLDQAVRCGFLARNDSGYQFLHDKMRESSYDLIPLGTREQFHYNTGILLYQDLDEEELDGTMQSVVDQINLGELSSIESVPLRMSFARLNYNAASQAMQTSNFSSAYLYLSRAVSIMPDDHWQSQYDTSLLVRLLQGRAAFACGKTEEAIEAVCKVISEARSFEDKVDAYYLMIQLFMSREEMVKAYKVSVDVLSQLGESVPSSVEQSMFAQLFGDLQQSFESMPDDQLANLPDMKDPSDVLKMKFLSEVTITAFFIGNKDIDAYASSKMVDLTLKKGASKFSASGFCHYAILVANKTKNHQMSYRIGKISCSLADRFGGDCVASVYSRFYAFIAPSVKPLNACASKLLKTFNIGMAFGNPASGFFAGIHYLQKAFASGANLQELTNHNDSQFHLVDQRGFSMAKTYLMCFKETLSLITNKSSAVDFDASEKDEMEKHFSKAVTFHRVVQSFWMGHYDRCTYFAKKTAMAENDFRYILIMFYQGLSCFIALRKTTRKKSDELIELASQSIKAVRSIKDECKSNYQNKLHLLEAELYSFKKKRDRAKLSYNAAITTARGSKFIHEEAIACELAGLHYKRYGDKKVALNSFREAERLYKLWGSQVRTDAVARHIQLLNND